MKFISKLFVFIFFVNWYGWAIASFTPAPTTAALARLTEAHGTVFKRVFVDRKREIWDLPKPARIGETYSEGTQLGTGSKSWAQIKFPHVTTRAWENSVVLIAPNQRIVYLMNGQMLFALKKDRPNKKDEYLVWTKVLQVRLRGTTVLLQADKGVSKITVLEGSADVTNNVDHSVVHVDPGVAFEVNYPPSIENQLPMPVPYPDFVSMVPIPESPGNLNKTEGTNQNNQNTVNDSASANKIDNIYAADDRQVTLFQTEKTTSSLHKVDPKSLLNHPLLTGFEERLESKPLIENSLTRAFPAAPTTVLPKDQDHQDNVDPLLLQNAHIVSLPDAANYKIGPNVARDFAISSKDLESSPPAGVIHKAPEAPKNSEPPHISEAQPESTGSSQPAAGSQSLASEPETKTTETPEASVAPIAPITPITSETPVLPASEPETKTTETPEASVAPIIPETPVLPASEPETKTTETPEASVAPIIPETPVLPASEPETTSELPQITPQAKEPPVISAFDSGSSESASPISTSTALEPLANPQEPLLPPEMMPNANEGLSSETYQPQSQSQSPSWVPELVREITESQDNNLPDNVSPSKEADILFPSEIP